jgi:hypothetical protein
MIGIIWIGQRRIRIGVGQDRTRTGSAHLVRTGKDKTGRDNAGPYMTGRQERRTRRISQNRTGWYSTGQHKTEEMREYKG